MKLSTTDYPKQLKSNLEYRFELLKAAENDVFLQVHLQELCKKNIIFWINLFCWTKDPRRIPDVLPFICYDSYQTDYILTVQSAITGGEDLLTEKSRDMGASWQILYALEHFWLFIKGSDFRIGSRKEDFVDRPKVMDTLFEKLRFNLSRQPNWLKPVDFNEQKHSTYMKLYNPDLENTITGESANEHFGSGGRSKAILLDEFSKWDNTIASAAWTSTADVTKCRLPLSTPLGSGNKFALLAKGTKEKIKKVTLHWTLHPDKAKDAYYIDHGQKIKIKTLKDAFKLWKKGIKVRSPWYDVEAERRSSADLAQEVDIDYHASGYPFFELEALSNQIVYKRFLTSEPIKIIPPYKYISVGLYDVDGKIEARVENDGWLRIYEYPEKNQQYVLGADIAEGLPKGDESTCVVRSKYTRNVIAVANGIYNPDDWAIKLRMVGKYYLDAKVAPENNNHGYSVCSDLKKTDCNLYWTEKEDKNGQKVIVKAGWSTNSQTRPQMLDQLAEEIRRDTCALRDEYIIDQCKTFVRNERGRPEADGNFLDDLVIATAIAGMVIQQHPYIYYTKKTETRQRYEVDIIRAKRKALAF